MIEAGDLVAAAVQALLPAVAAYGATRAGIATAMERATRAQAEADRAHLRIDTIVFNQPRKDAA